MATAKKIRIIVLLVFGILSCSRQPVHPGPAVAGADIIIYAEALQDGIPQFFSYRFQDKHINFFVVRFEGRILSFLDACMKCYPKKLGFRFKDGTIACKACNERYPVSEIEKGFGSCYPVRIKGKVEEDKYFITAKELENTGARFFR